MRRKPCRRRKNKGEENMKLNDHVTKARRIEATMVNKLDPDKDYELVLEAYMLAGTHLLNAILHKFSVTEEEFDLSHSDKPKLNMPIDATLRPLFDDMKYIEDLRPGYLRGARAWSVDDGKRCLRSYQQVKQFAEKVLG